ncbi:hypothetical protein [Hansschlegelia plantiphila]|uniref:Uncharacterized protein n=1 Tax=Hansschlegelia plantiphila TaxID=374655 RepID=A0A9W6MW59_9HYPH|nr:hypothetical protein [Hansschlegelia plantiphila]GLK68651.1 hypothetical protein GCM10008179_22890 [Hansschlegelia plantiphila]
MGAPVPAEARVDPVSRIEAKVDVSSTPEHEAERPDPPRAIFARAGGGGYAPLVAQLATAIGLSQTQDRRRASVKEALDAYRSGRDKPKRSHGVA